MEKVLRIKIDPNPRLRSGLTKPARKVLRVVEKMFRAARDGEWPAEGYERVMREAHVGRDTVDFAFRECGERGITKLLDESGQPVTLPAVR